MVNIYTIPPDLPFADTLAEWILAKYSSDNLELARVLLLLPTRRACIAMREAFLRVSGGKAILLPRMQPLGEIDENMLITLGNSNLPDFPTPGFEFKRLFILAKLIAKRDIRIDHAIILAKELADLLDELEREQISLSEIEKIVPDNFAEHWQQTVDFLKIISEYFPIIAEQENLVSKNTSSNKLFAMLCKQWEASPPDYPIIAAGATGSMPATAELLAAIAKLAKGEIVLPGLDTESDDDYISAIGENHPQWGMLQLLKKFKLERHEIKPLKQLQSPARNQLLREIMRPASLSQAWQNLEIDMKSATAGISQVHCANEQEEATVISLILREVLQTPGKTAALITYNRKLAERVTAIIKRFAVNIDDSTGTPLLQTPTLVFLRLLLEHMQESSDLSLISLLKHPLACAGMQRIECLQAVREYELIRRSNPEVRETYPDNVKQLLQNCELIFADLREIFQAGLELPLLDLVQAHIKCVEALASDKIWQSDEGEEIIKFITELELSQPDLAIKPTYYPYVLENLLLGKVIRPDYGMHPRLKILSPLEARMQSFDRIIIGGLSEGSFPPQITADAWFNRNMRKTIGLPSPERSIGLAAHDFYSLASCKEVFFTDSEKIAGTPTTGSRWSVKLGVLLKKFNLSIQDKSWNYIAANLDMPEQVRPIERPAPCPPLAARPQSLSVTGIETWLRNPYAIYAANILKLRKLEPLMRELDGSDFGNKIHKALENFVRNYPNKLTDNAYQKLLEYGMAELQPILNDEIAKALWIPRLQKIAAFFIKEESERRINIAEVQAEITANYKIGGFTLKGRADRVERYKDGSLAIIDYKTGQIPSNKDIEKGIANQLVLLGLIFTEQGDIISGLQYWKLQGGKEAGLIKPIAGEKIAAYMEEAKIGLSDLIDKYNQPQTPYIAKNPSKYDDYKHLARFSEWS